MRRQTGDVTKIGLYLLSAFLLAALISPWLYNAGKFLAEFTASSKESGILESIGNSARKADFPTYFKRALLFSGLVLIVPLVYALKMGRRSPELTDSPYSVNIPTHTLAHENGQPLQNPASGWIQLLSGFFLAGGLLFVMGMLLISFGWFSWNDPIDWGRGLKKSVGPAIGASLVEEFVFRGMLLGVFLRSFRPTWAIVFLSLIFSALHFLQPPDELVVSNPESSLAGFEMLKLLAMRFLDPLSFLNEFFTLFLVGIILSYARYATASLWLPIGLHAGWVFAYKLYGYIADRDSDLQADYQFLIGSDLKEGLIPIVTLIVTGTLVHLFSRILKPAPQAYAEDHRGDKSPGES